MVLRRGFVLAVALLTLWATTGAGLPGRDEEGYPTVLTAPQELAGMTKTDDVKLQQVAGELTAQLKVDTNATSSVAAFYEDPADATRLVAIVGATAYLEDPDAELADAISGATGSNELTNLRDIDPGPLRGVARCGNTNEGEIPVALCGWADNGSLAIAFFFNRTVEEGAQLLLKMRNEMTHR